MNLPKKLYRHAYRPACPLKLIEFETQMAEKLSEEVTRLRALGCAVTFIIDEMIVTLPENHLMSPSG